MNIPAYNDMMQELFQAIKELGGSGTIKEIDDKTIEILGLSPDILAVMHGDSSKSEVEYRLAWTRTYMKKVGILENSTRGVWALTTSGRELQAIKSEEI
ncbi:restriction endonuclease, partial [Lactonifactor longoviformis]